MTIKQTRSGIEYRDDASLIISPEPASGSAFNLALTAGCVGSLIMFVVVDITLFATMLLNILEWQWPIFLWLPLLILVVYWTGVSLDLLRLCSAAVSAMQESAYAYIERARRSADMYDDIIDAPYEPVSRTIEDRPILINRHQPAKPAGLPEKATSVNYEANLPGLSRREQIEREYGIAVPGPTPTPVPTSTTMSPPKQKIIRRVITPLGPVDARDLAQFAKEIFIHGTAQRTWERRFKKNHTGVVDGREVYKRCRDLFLEIGVLERGPAQNSKIRILFDDYNELSEYLLHSGLIKVSESE